MRTVSDDEQKVLDCYADLAMREMMDFRDDIKAGRITKKRARGELHGTVGVFIRFLCRGRDVYADKLIQKFERMISRRRMQ